MLRLLTSTFSFFLLTGLSPLSQASDKILRGHLQPETSISKTNKHYLSATLTGHNPDDPEYNFYMGEFHEKNQTFEKASKQYELYLANKKNSVNREQARFKLNIIKTALRKKSIGALQLYLAALNARQAHQYDQAQDYCQQLRDQHPLSYLADDAEYLQAYIEFIDKNALQSALEKYQLFIESNPNSEYIDTSIYGKALAHEQLKQYSMAETLLERLKEKHTAFSLNFANFYVPKDNLLSRLWFKRSSRRLEILKNKKNLLAQENSILASKNFAFGMGGRLTYDQPVGSQKNFSSLWKLIEDRDIPTSYLTHWITRHTNWRWESRQRLIATINAGYTPVIAYWYFGDEISPEFVKKHQQDYYDNIQNKLIPLIKNIPNIVILIEPEFNKRGIEKWPEWDNVVTRAIKMIKAAAPYAKVGLTAGDWGHYEVNDTLANISQAVETSDFVGFMLMSSASLESPLINPVWQVDERATRIVDYLHGKFNKPLFLAYIALSTAQDWEQKQASIIQQIMNNLPYYIDKGVFGFSYFSLFDNPKQVGWFAQGEPYFGLYDYRGYAKQGATSWQSRVQSIIDLDTTAPQLSQPISSNIIGSVDLTATTIELQAQFSEWVRWNLLIEGLDSGAKYSAQGAGDKVWLAWSGQSFSGRFTTEQCKVSLTAYDKAGNYAEFIKDDYFSISRLESPQNLYAIDTNKQTVQAWGASTDLYALANDTQLVITLEQANAGINIPLDIDNISLSKVELKQIYLEVNIRLRQLRDGIYIRLQSQQSQQQLMLSAYLNPQYQDWQYLQIPLSDFDKLNITDLAELNNVSLYTISDPAHFELGGITLTY